MRVLWGKVREDVRNAAWLLPTVALIYAIIWPLLDFPGRK